MASREGTEESAGAESGDEAAVAARPGLQWPADQCVTALQLFVRQQRWDDGERRGQEQALPGAEHRRDGHQDGGARRPRGRRHREGGGGQGADGIGCHHHGPGPPPVAGVPPDGQQRGAGNPVRGEHGPEQQRATVLGEDVPRQGHRVKGVANVRGELTGYQEPEAAMTQRGEATGHHPAPPEPGSLSLPAAGSCNGKVNSSTSTGADPAGRCAGSVSRPWYLGSSRSAISWLSSFSSLGVR